MVKKETVSQDDLLKVLKLLDHTGIRYWIDGGWGVDMLFGQQTRKHRDIDIDFDSQYTETLLQVLKDAGYEVVTDWGSVRIELYHPSLGYIDIHPFVLNPDGSAKQADLEGGWYEFSADFFDTVVFQGREVACISLKGQKIFHTGYELRDVDRHDIEIIEKLLVQR